MTRKQTPPPADDPMLDRALPHNLEAERSVLGAIIMHNSAFEHAAELLKPTHFYRDAHRRIYSALVTVVDERKAEADFVTLREELSRTGQLDEVGGPAYLASLVDGLPHVTNVKHYAGIVREKYLLRQIIKTGGEMITAAYDGEDAPADILKVADRSLLDLQMVGDRRGLVKLRQSRIFEDLEQRVANKGQLWGIDTGYKSINDQTMGWQAGDLIILAARPSVGKTAFVLNTAVAAARGEKHVAIFSLEMRQRQLEYRMLSSLSGVPSMKMLTGYLTDHDYAQIATALGVFNELPIDISDRAGQTVGDIRMACRRLRNEGQLDLVVVDYVQLMPGTLARRGATRNEEITDISLRLKALAGELAAPVIVLSQLKRQEGRPQLSDLRESGSLEQDADLVCFLHRKNHKEGGLTNFIIEKARNGPTGTCNLSLDRDTTTFHDGGEETPEQASAASEADKAHAKTRAIIRNRAGRRSN